MVVVLVVVLATLCAGSKLGLLIALGNIRRLRRTLLWLGLLSTLSTTGRVGARGRSSRVVLIVACSCLSNGVGRRGRDEGIKNGWVRERVTC